VTGRGKQRIQPDSQRVLQHHWNNSLKNRAVHLQARVVVDLNQPRLEISINHEIKSKYLEVVLMPAMVYGAVIGLDDV
jgi:hypothetical protein